MIDQRHFFIRLGPRKVATYLVGTVIDWMAVQVVWQFISVDISCLDVQGSGLGRGLKVCRTSSSFFHSLTCGCALNGLSA